jgi:hypothetical protein
MHNMQASRKAMCFASGVDQVNFPFLFSSTDPVLATIANGGHVTNPAVLIFSDFQSFLCGRAAHVLVDVFGESGDVRLIFKHVPSTKSDFILSLLISCGLHRFSN